MNPDLMRAIDYWVGIPLVFLFTLVSRVLRFIGLAASPAGRPRNILVIQLAEMGTMVVAYPALRKARELHPDATLHFLCFTQIRSSVEMLEMIPSGNIITIDSPADCEGDRDIYGCQGEGDVERTVYLPAGEDEATARTVLRPSRQK